MRVFQSTTRRRHGHSTQHVTLLTSPRGRRTRRRRAGTLRARGRSPAAAARARARPDTARGRAVNERRAGKARTLRYAASCDAHAARPRAPAAASCGTRVKEAMTTRVRTPRPHRDAVLLCARRREAVEKALRGLLAALGGQWEAVRQRERVHRCGARGHGTRSTFCRGSFNGTRPVYAADAQRVTGVRVLPNKPVRLVFESIKPKRAGGHAPPRVVTSYLFRRSARRRDASLADMGRTSASRGRVQLVTSVTWLK